MAKGATVRVRLHAQIMAQAIGISAAMAQTVSDAVRIFLTHVAADNQTPFALKIPKTDMLAAKTATEEIGLERQAGFGSASEPFDRNKISST